MWSDFINPLYFLSNSRQLADDALRVQLLRHGLKLAGLSNWALVSADVLLTILPVILIYIVAQRWILSGLLSGSVKG